MSTRRILITIDHKWRDLPGHVWLGLHLEDRGFDVRFARQGMERAAICRHRPDAIVVNHVYESRRRQLLARMRGYGLRTVVLMTEGIPAFGKIPDLDRERYGDSGCVDLQLTWNRVYQDFVRDLGKWPESAVRMVGVPRFDFYRPPLRSLLPGPAEFARTWGLKPDRPNVVFTTNFTHARFHVQESDVLRADYERLGIQKAMSKHDDYPRRDHESRERLRKALLSIAPKLGPVNIVLRPHPGEDHSYWDAILREMKSAHPGISAALVIQAFIWDLLANAAVLVERSCTTGVEGWILGLPTIECRLNPDEWYVSESHAAGSRLATSEEELTELILEAVKGSRSDESLQGPREKFLKQWCGPLDGRSTERAADAIEELVSGSPAPRYPFSPGFALRSASFRAQTAFDHAIHDLLAGSHRTFDKRGRMDKWAHFSDIAAWRSRLSPVPRTSRVPGTPPAVPAAGNNG